MPTGFVGSADLAQNVDTLLTPSGGVGDKMVVNIYFASRVAAEAKVRIAIGTGASPDLKDYILFDRPLVGNRDGEKTGIVVNANEKIWVRSSINGVSARCSGIAAT